MADYQSMSTDELLALCDDQDIPVPADNSQVTKADLIRRLNLGADAVRAEEQNTHVGQTLRQPGNLTEAEQAAAATAGPATVEGNASYSERDAADAPFDPGVEADEFSRRPVRGPAASSGKLGNASANLAGLSRSEIEQLSLMLDKLRAAGGLEAPATGPRISLQQQGQNHPIDVAATAQLKIGDVLQILTEAGHQVDPRMIPRRGWVVRRAEGFEDGYHDGPAFLSVATNDGRNLYAPLPGLEEDDYTEYQARQEAKKHAGIAAAFREQMQGPGAESYSATR
jgi:hypothetical protein